MKTLANNQSSEITMFNFLLRLWINNQAINKKTKLASLYIQVYISTPGKYEAEEFPLKLRWPVDRIDREAGLLLPRERKDPDVNDFNLIIRDQMSQYNDIAKMYRLANRTLDMSLLKRELRFNDPTKSLVKYMDLKRTELYNRREISKQTWKNVGSTIKVLTEYQEVIHFDEIDEAWMRKFKAHLRNKNIAKVTKRNSNAIRHMKPSTIWTRMRDLKAYLALANKEATIFVRSEAIDFPNPEPQQVTTYLNRDEVRILLILLRSGSLTTMEEVILKAFLFTCFTSLRISDLMRANVNWMISSNVLQFTQHKNRDRRPKTVSIPFIPIAKQLVEDASSTFFDLPTEQEFNRTLKDIGAKAEIKKRLTSHVGRHTFGYLYMTTVGNIMGLKEIMGHSKLSTTERYSHLDEDYNFNQLMKVQSGFDDLRHPNDRRKSIEM